MSISHSAALSIFLALLLVACAGGEGTSDSSGSTGSSNCFYTGYICSSGGISFGDGIVGQCYLNTYCSSGGGNSYASVGYLDAKYQQADLSQNILLDWSGDTSPGNVVYTIIKNGELLRVIRPHVILHTTASQYTDFDILPDTEYCYAVSRYSARQLSTDYKEDWSTPEKCITTTAFDRSFIEWEVPVYSDYSGESLGYPVIQNTDSGHNIILAPNLAAQSVYMFDEYGDLIWEREITDYLTDYMRDGNYVDQRVTDPEGNVYDIYFNYDGYIATVASYTSEGNLRWKIELPPEEFFSTYANVTATQYYTPGRMLLGDDGYLYFDVSIRYAYIDGHKYCIDRTLYKVSTDGDVIWKFSPERLHDTSYAGQTSVAVTPDGVVYAGFSGDKLYSLGENGLAQWSYAAAPSFLDGTEVLSYFSQILIHGDMLIFANNDGINALDTDGSMSWKRDLIVSLDNHNYDPPFKSHDPVPVIAIAPNGNIIVPSLEYNIYALNPDDGSTVWTYDVEERFDQKPIITTSGQIIVRSIHVHALDVSGNLLWRYAPDNGMPIASSGDSVYLYQQQQKKLISINSDAAQKAYSTLSP